MTSEAVVDFKHERETVLKPMHAKYTSFHETCKSAERGNIWVKFEALAQGGVHVCLSPACGYDRATSYEVIMGAHGNTDSVIRTAGQRLSRGFGAACSPFEYRKFWVQVLGNTIAIGTGDTLGQNVIAKCVDAAPDSAAGGAEHVAAMADDEGEATDGQSTADAATATGDASGAAEAAAAASSASADAGTGVAGRGPASLQYVAFTSMKTPIRFRNITLGHCAGADLSSDIAPSFDPISAMGAAAVAPGSETYMADLEEKARENKRRADRFGVTYQQPGLEAVLPYSEVKRLQSGGLQSAAAAAAVNTLVRTGIDQLSEEEIKKREARAARFGKALPAQPASVHAAEESRAQAQARAQAADTASAQAEPQVGTGGIVASGFFAGSKHASREEREEEQRKREARASRFGVGLKPVQPLAEEHAIVAACRASHRKDPGDAARRENVLHIFAVDQNKFLQIRTADVMLHFQTYGFNPTYVEWLSDQACNVHLADETAAQRCLEQLGSTISEPVGMQTGAAAVATPAAAAPAAAASAGQEGEEDADEGMMTNEDVAALMGAPEPEPERVATAADLAAMGWLVGKTIVKKNADRYGWKGAKVRNLMRIAVATDVLLEKPDEPSRSVPLRGGKRKWGAKKVRRERRGGDGDGGGGGGGRRKRGRDDNDTQAMDVQQIDFGAFEEAEAAVRRAAKTQRIDADADSAAAATKHSSDAQQLDASLEAVPLDEDDDL